jgi:cobaltochelatase CobS
MAGKASVIRSVDLSTERVTYETPNGVVKTDRFQFMSKVDRLAVLKHLGWRSSGKPPMHCNDDEILSAWHGIIRTRGGVPAPEAPKVPNPTKEVIMPKSPEPKAPNTESRRNQGGALEQALGEILGGIVEGRFTEVLTEVSDLREAIAKVQPKVTEVHLPTGEVRVLDGVQHHVFPEVLVGVAEREALWLVGPAGTGKSTIAEQAAQAVGLDFSSRSCSAQTTETSLLGYMSATGDYIGTEFRKRYEFGGVFLLDEVDNGNPNVLTVLNSALSNSFMAFPDGMVTRHKDFVLVATANTFGNGATSEYVGRNPIDKAFVDRFSFIQVDYDPKVEEAMLASVVGLPTQTATKWLEVVRRCRSNAETYGLKVIVSPRATLKGAKWLRNSVSMQRTLELVVLKGLKDDQSAKLLDGVTL